MFTRQRLESFVSVVSYWRRTQFQHLQEIVEELHLHEKMFEDNDFPQSIRARREELKTLRRELMLALPGEDTLPEGEVYVALGYMSSTIPELNPVDCMALYEAFQEGLKAAKEHACK